MKRSLMEILACPLCKGDLELEVEEEDSDEIIKGALLCRNCNERYPIEDGIPDLRPPELRGEG